MMRNRSNETSSFFYSNHMFKRHRSRGPQSGRPRSSGGPSRHGSGGGFGGRSGFAKGPRRSGGGGGRKGAQSSIDISQLVKKAIQTTETTVFHPEHKFSDFAIHPKLKAIIRGRGFEHPTPIQDGAIPHILKGRDVIGVANTGTGKTAAFLIPLIDKTFHHPQEKVLILVPTRELALQIDGEFQAFSKGSGLRSALCIGGTNMTAQVRALAQRPSFVIGTPGRVKDLIERGHLDLTHFRNVVLDEVDRMLDMGFIKDITWLLSLLPRERQSLFFSATLERGARDLATQFVHDPVTVAIKARPTSENVDQDVIYVRSKEEKIETLHELLNRPECEKTIIFSRTKHGADRLAKTLVTRGFKAAAIHGNLNQNQRGRALRAFRHGEYAILVATDVAARGLDIDGITHVINFDLPMSYDDYIHRIGRTGRANRTGTAITFVEQYSRG